MQFLREHVAVWGKSAAAEISRNYPCKVIGRERRLRRRAADTLIPEPEDFPIPANERQRVPAEVETCAE